MRLHVDVGRKFVLQQEDSRLVRADYRSLRKSTEGEHFEPWQHESGEHVPTYKEGVKRICPRVGQGKVPCCERSFTQDHTPCEG